MQIVRIPNERIKILVGETGQTKDYLERRMNVKLIIDSDGGVLIKGEPVDEYIAKDIVKAIGRGFEPALALKLLSDEYGLRIINLRDYAKNEKALVRIKGRIIGQKGRTKEIIFEEVGANVVVFGHTVSVISKLETLDYATEAIFRIIDGAPHSSVYAYLEKCRRKIKEDEIRNMF
ncbi:MAG: KH domain-containing protein [Candidatus Micrarchaeota archaeon]|nr:KH domain-containing protein [Candidatus Micrarchaeota archaeon]